MDLGRIECGNKVYTPKFADSSEVGEAQYLHLVVEVPAERTVPRGSVEKRSFFFKRAHKDDFWSPISTGYLKSVSALGFHQSVAACESDDEQKKHIGDMALMIDGEVVDVDV